MQENSGPKKLKHTVTNFIWVVAQAEECMLLHLVVYGLFLADQIWPVISNDKKLKDKIINR